MYRAAKQGKYKLIYLGALEKSQQRKILQFAVIIS